MGLLAFLLTGEAFAQWTSVSDDKWCEFRHDYADGTEFRFGVAKTLDIGHIALWTNNRKSVAEDREYSVRVETDTGYVGTFPASGMRTPRGATGLFVRIRPRTALAAITRSRYVDLSTEGRLIGRYDLAGAAAAMAGALKCVAAKA